MAYELHRKLVEEGVIEKPRVAYSLDEGDPDGRDAVIKKHAEAAFAKVLPQYADARGDWDESSRYWLKKVVPFAKDYYAKDVEDDLTKGANQLAEKLLNTVGKLRRMRQVSTTSFFDQLASGGNEQAARAKALESPLEYLNKDQQKKDMHTEAELAKLASVIEHELGVNVFYKLVDPRDTAEALKVLAIAMVEYAVSTLPIGVNTWVQNEASSDFSYALGKLVSGERCRVKEWWWDHKIPHMVDNTMKCAFSAALGAVFNPAAGSGEQPIFNGFGNSDSPSNAMNTLWVSMLMDTISVVGQKLPDKATEM